MPPADFLAGAALFAAMLLGVGSATAILVRRRLRHLAALELGLAGVVVGSAVLIAVHLLPLVLGVLSRATVLAAAALAVGLAALVRPAAGGAGRAGRAGDEERPPAPASGPLTWAAAALAALFAAAAALADLARWAGDELVGVDPLTFHLPNVARWIQHGTVWQIDQFTPLLAQGYYPQNGDVLLLSAVLPWHNDFLVRLPITFYLVVLAVAVFAAARELRASSAAAVLVAAAVVSLPVAGLATIPRALPDSLMWSTYVCGVLFLLRHARTSRRSDLVVAGVALAIACGTKWYGVSSVPVLLAVWLAARLLAARRAGAAADGPAATAAGAATAAPGPATAADGPGTAAAGPATAADGPAATVAGPAATGPSSTARGGVAPVLADAVLVGALALTGTIVWLVRNAVFSGNPFFPVDVAPLGVTIFGAPPDVIRDQVGFSIADYAGDPAVLGRLAGEVVEGLGSAPAACAIGLLLAVALARARGRAPDARVLLLAAGSVALALLYVVTPATALGLPGDPSLANANTRYAVPALLLAMPAVAWAAGRLPRLAGRALELALAAGALLGALHGYEVRGAGDILLATAGLAALAAAAAALWRARGRRLLLAGAAVLLVLGGLGAANRMQDRINDGRYRSIDPGIDAMLDAAPPHARIALAADWTVGGLTPIWPAFGTRMQNEVEFLGRFVEGFLTPYPDEARFRAALRRGRFDVLVVGRGFYPPQPTREQRWAIDAGWRTIALTRRLRVLVPPAGPSG